MLEVKLTVQSSLVVAEIALTLKIYAVNLKNEDGWSYGYY